MTTRNSLLRSLLALMFCTVIAGFSQSSAPLGPAPGKMIDVDGHKLHIHCVGPHDAKPAVILEAGGGTFSRDWAAVQRLLAERVRTCAYDRAGLGWSDLGPAPRTLAQEVFELHTLLESAKISGPFVLVGQSLGALYVRLFTKDYGNDVAGIVLVDPADESSMLFNVPAKRWMKLRDQARGRTIPPARSTGPPSTGYKPEEDYLGDEAQLLYLEREKNPQPFGDRPLFVLAAGKRPPPPGMTEHSYKDIRHAIDQDRAEAAHLSRNSKFVLDVKSGHDIQIDDPKAVAEAVEEVVAAVKNQTKLADITVPSAGLAANVTSIFTAPVAAQVLVQSAGPANITNITVDGTGGDQGCTPSNIWLAGIFYSSSSGEVNRVVMACTLAESLNDPLHRKLRQVRCLRRRFDCYRVERTSSRAGVATAEVQRLSRRTFSPTIETRQGLIHSEKQREPSSQAITLI